MKFTYLRYSLLFLCVSVCPRLYAADEVLAPAAPPQSQPTAQTNKLIGEAFLAKNMSVPGVVTLPSGLQYKVIRSGQGARPAVTDTVTVNYLGKLVNGKEFDSSYKRGEPATFALNQVIPGWTQALSRMNKGAIWELYIPSALAYGEQGMPPVIGPNETLIFKVELLNIN